MACTQVHPGASEVQVRCKPGAIWVQGGGWGRGQAGARRVQAGCTSVQTCMSCSNLNFMLGPTPECAGVGERRFSVVGHPIHHSTAVEVNSSSLQEHLC